jgi:hypothetical protein
MNKQTHSNKENKWTQFMDKKRSLLSFLFFFLTKKKVSLYLILIKLFVLIFSKYKHN